MSFLPGTASLIKEIDSKFRVNVLLLRNLFLKKLCGSVDGGII